MANRFACSIPLKLVAQAQITGDASDNAVVGPNGILPFKARLVAARVSCSTMASSKTALISVYAGAVKVVDQATLVSTATDAKGVLTVSKKGTIHAAGVVFSLKEESGASSNIDGLSVDLVFEQMGLVE
jgi:hypothetical protein